MTQQVGCSCGKCGAQIQFEKSNYRYLASGLSNVILQGVEVGECVACGNREVRIPRMTKIHRTIAQALANSPARLTGEQLRYLRKHLGLTGERLGGYLHTDRTKISKWESGEHKIGPSNDRLMRLLVASLDAELRPGVSIVAEHLPLISDEAGSSQQLHVDVATLTWTFLTVPVGAAA